MVDSKENNKLDLGVKGLNSIMVRRTLTKKIAIRSSISHSKYQKRKKKLLFSTINLNQFQKSTEKQVGMGHMYPLSLVPFSKTFSVPPNSRHNTALLIYSCP